MRDLLTFIAALND